MLRLNLFILILTTILALCNNVAHAKFPDDPKPCKYEDTSCITHIIEFLLHDKYDGFSSLNLVKTDPLKVASIVIQQGAESPVNIDLNFKQNDIIGFKNIKMHDVKGFGKDLTKRHELRLIAPELSLVGDYTIKGRVLVLPITGSGKSNITMVNAKIKIVFTGTPVQKDDGIHMGVTDVKLDVDPERMIYSFGNLFNGDKALGDNMNAFLNENWQDIYREVRATFSDAFAKIFASVINNVFNKYPYEKYFTE